MTETITLDPHFDCTASHRITKLLGSNHLAALMPGTIILTNGWEYMKLCGRQGWTGVSGTRFTDDDLWAMLEARQHIGCRVSLLHMGAA